MTAPSPSESSIWSLGSRTVKQAVAQSGLSRQELWELMDNGTLTWMPHGGRGTRLIAWRSLVNYLEREHKAFAAQKVSACARTD